MGKLQPQPHQPLQQLPNHALIGFTTCGRRGGKAKEKVERKEVWEGEKPVLERLPPRILGNLWGSAGGLCGKVCIVENLLKNPHTEPRQGSAELWEPSPASQTLQLLLLKLYARSNS